MCGRYVSASTPQQIADYFGATIATETLIEPNYNVAPTDPVPVVRVREGQRQVDLCRWGLIPSWAKSASIGSKMINARIETVTEKSAFRNAVRRRRCIVPADAFYEWTTIPDPNGKKPRKQPWCIRRVDDAPFSFAGMFEFWRESTEAEGDEPHTGEERPLVMSCTILTTAANEAMSTIHDRMPAMVAPALWDDWLDRDNEDAESLLAALPPAPSELFTIYPVSTAVNNSRSSGAELAEPIELEEQGTLL